MKKVELYELIRRDFELEGKSIRQIARERRIHRREVRQAIANPIPPARKLLKRNSPQLGMYHKTIDEWLVKDREKGRKQRHTARRIWARLRDEYGSEAAESTVRDYVRRRKRELGITIQEVFIEQEPQPGEESQVDFGEADIVLRGEEIRVFLFLMRCHFSGKTFVMGFRNQKQQVFLEGLASAFTYFGGVFERVRFDNLKPAVKKVLRGRRRQETDRFVALRSHYLFESAFCRPGVEGAHEKGGVEGEIGRFRRNHLVPLPEVESLSELNDYLLDCCRRDDSRRMAQRRESVEERWRMVVPTLRALPREPFDITETAPCVVDNKSRAQVLRNYYSAPVSYAGEKVTARILSNTITLLSRGKVLAVHERLSGPYEESLQLDHYLDLLRDKPGAFAGSKALSQARRSGQFPACYERLWEALKERYGEAEGTRQLIDVLLLLREAPVEAVTMAVEMALSYGCMDGHAVSHILRQLQEPTRPESDSLLDIGPLRLYERDEPDLSQYDVWLAPAGSEEAH